MRRNRGSNACSSNCCWKPLDIYYPDVGTRNIACKWGLLSHTWSREMKLKVSEWQHLIISLHSRGQTIIANVKEQRERSKMKKGSFGRDQAMNTSKPSNNFSSVLIWELFKNAQSQSANLAMINSFILMKEGLLKYKCHSRGEEGKPFSCYHKTCLQPSLWLLTPQPTSTELKMLIP